jgi:hypothetical protein
VVEAEAEAMEFLGLVYLEDQVALPEELAVLHLVALELQVRALTERVYLVVIIQQVVVVRALLVELAVITWVVLAQLVH